MDISGDAEVGGVDDLVGGGVGKDGLGVDTSLVGEGAETGDVVVEGDVNLDSLGDKVLNVLELVELVLALDVLGIGDDHASHQASKRGNSVALANTEDGGVNVGRTGLQGGVGVGNGTSGVVVEMRLNVAGDDAAESADEVVDLAGGSASDGIGNTLEYC